MSRDPIGTSGGGTDEYWTAMARTADLVRKLTALADRYEAVDSAGDARAGERQKSVALMRATAEAGRALIRSLAPPPLPPGVAQPAPTSVELADSGRFRAACDGDEEAGDRASALADPRAARADRELSGARPLPDLDSQARSFALITDLAARAVVRQAQGVLMQRAGLTAGEAFEALLLAAADPMRLEDVAQHVVRTSELPSTQRTT